MNKKHNKSLFLSIFLAFVLVGCGGGNNSSNSPTSSSELPNSEISSEKSSATESGNVESSENEPISSTGNSSIISSEKDSSSDSSSTSQTTSSSSSNSQDSSSTSSEVNSNTSSSSTSSEISSEPISSSSSSSNSSNSSISSEVIKVMLDTPVVTISSSGLASWNAVTNATSYKYVINGGEEVPTSNREVQLQNGDTIEVQACGDPTLYIDSAYSSILSYEEEIIVVEPQYLGIYASSTAPNAQQPINHSLRRSYQGDDYGFSVALENYFEDVNNRPSPTLPTESNYDSYAKVGDKMYVQVFLNNPDDFDILSIKLNGTKYSATNGLKTIDIPYDNSIYTCVYVELYMESSVNYCNSYQVSDIEYLENTFISDEQFTTSNSTVSIGLSMEALLPSILSFEPTGLNHNSCSAIITMSDAFDVVEATNGWMFIAVYDGENIVELVGLEDGSNNVSCTNLLGDTYYALVTGLYADLNDGEGVSLHIIDLTPIKTNNVCSSLILQSENTYLEDLGVNGAVIHVSSNLLTEDTAYTRIEVIDIVNDQVVYTSTEYDGEMSITTNILNNHDYRVKVYYQQDNAEEKYVENNVSTLPLNPLSIVLAEEYLLYDDLVLSFALTEPHNTVYYEELKSLSLMFYNKYDSSYIAEDVIALIQNPNLISELEQEQQSIYEQMNDVNISYDEMMILQQRIEAIGTRLAKLYNAVSAWESNFDRSTDLNFWNEEASKDNYCYLFTYGVSEDDNIICINDRYYMVLKDYVSLYKDIYLTQELTFVTDTHSSSGESTSVCEPSFNIYNPRESAYLEIGDIEYDVATHKLIFNIHNINVEENEKYNVYNYIKVELNSGEDNVIYESPKLSSIDEKAWLEEYLECVRNNEDYSDLTTKYFGEYANPYSITIDVNDLYVGNNSVEFYYGGYYDEYTTHFHSEIVLHEKKLDAPIVTIIENRAEWNSSECWSGYIYIINDGVEQYTEDSYVYLNPGDTIKVKSLGNDNGYLDSDYSNPVTYPLLTKLETPNISIDNEGLVSWNEIENASYYLCLYDNGNEVDVYSTSIQLANNESIQVKAVGDNITYCDSDYSERLGFNLEDVFTISDLVQDFDDYIDSEVTITGRVFACDNQGLYLQDQSGSNIYVYCGSFGYTNVSIGQQITATGNVKHYYSLPQVALTQSLEYGSFGEASYSYIYTTIDDMINELPIDHVYDHKIYYLTGTVTEIEGYYYLVDGESKVMFKASTQADDLENIVNNYLNTKIVIRIVVSDYQSTYGCYRVHPLRGDDACIEEVVDYNFIDQINEIDQVYTIKGTVIAVSSTGFVIEDDTGSILVYMGNEWACDVSIGDIYFITGTCGTYGGLYQLDTNPTYTYVNHEVVVQPSPIVVDSTNINEHVSEPEIRYVKLTGILNINGNYYNVTIPSTNIVGSIVSPIDNLSSFNGKEIEIEGYFTGVNGTNTQYYRVIAISIKEVENDPVETDEIRYLMINDTHGALIDSESSVALGKVDTLYQTLENNYGNYIFIHNGDAFQGTYVSGATYGYSLIEGLNAMEIDCFVIGNHEFDWGIEKIGEYKDGDLSNGEANFPFLGANIIDKSTNEIVSWMEPYTIIEYGDYKVGIIGVIGETTETSIIAKNVKNYDFIEVAPVVEEYASYLRTTKDCDAVVVATHEYNVDVNNAIANLTGNSKVDAIFCGHKHWQIAEKIIRSDGKEIPVVQNLAKNELVSEVICEYASDTKLYNGMCYINQYQVNSYDPSTRVASVVSKYQDIIDEGNTVLGYTNDALYESELATIIVEGQLNYDYSSYEDFEIIDAALINNGTVRATINSGEILKSEVYEVTPFDNVIVLCKIKGKYLKNIYGSNSGFLALALDDNYSSYEDLEDETVYNLAVIDYVFENRTYYSDFDYLSEDDYVVTSLFARNITYFAISEQYPIN